MELIQTVDLPPGWKWLPSELRVMGSVTAPTPKSHLNHFKAKHNEVDILMPMESRFVCILHKDPVECDKFSAILEIPLNYFLGPWFLSLFKNDGSF